MINRNCLDLAISCPDVMCIRCKKPYITWIWKDNLLFTCSECNELVFNTDGLQIDDSKLPNFAFLKDMEWPCEDNPDPECVEIKKMLFIENYQDLEFLKERFSSNMSYRNYSEIQNLVGRAFESIIDMIC